MWFEVAWLMAVTKNGVSAVSLQPLLGLGWYETAWAMCHKLRTAMGRTSVDLLSGDIEVNETFIGGVKTGGKRGRGAPGNVFGPDPHPVRTPPLTQPVWPESLAGEPLDRPWRDSGP